MDNVPRLMRQYYLTTAVLACCPKCSHLFKLNITKMILCTLVGYDQTQANDASVETPPASCTAESATFNYTMKNEKLRLIQFSLDLTLI